MNRRRHPLHRPEEKSSKRNNSSLASLHLASLATLAFFFILPGFKMSIPKNSTSR